MLALTHCGVDVTLILADVFGIKVSSEPVPPLITLTTYANEDEIEPVNDGAITEPVVCVPLVTFTNPATDEVRAGIEPTPPSMIEFTLSNPSLIVCSSFGSTYDDVV